MKTDIEIAQEAKMYPIKDVAAKLNITEDDLEFYGKYKAKLSDELWDKIKDREDGKLVLVTAINPTPAGEGRRPSVLAWPGAKLYLAKKLCCLKRAILGPLLWYQGRRCRRRLCPGCSNGRLKPSFYGGFPRHYLSE